MGSVPTSAEETLPLFPFDDTALNRIMAVTGMLRYNAVLDANKLRDSLTTLLHTGNWRKLRGRLQLDSNDKLHISIPARANKQRPAIRFRQTVLGQPIKSHPLANKLAQPRPRSSVQEAIAGFSEGDIQSFLVPPDWPRSLAEYIDPDRDEPILGLHVLSFTDATLIVLGFSHVMMDGGGLESLLSAWSSVLAGNTAAVPDLALDDPLDAVRSHLKQSAPERFALQDKVIDFASLMPEDGAAPPTDPNWDTSSPDSRWRTISFSASALSKITQTARSTCPEGVFISEDDAVTAWIISTVAGTYPAARPVNAMRLYDMRGRLPAVFPPDHAYIQNAYQMAWTLFDAAGDAADRQKLGHVAAALRGSLAQQTTPEQVVAAMAGREGGNTPLYGSPAGAFFTLNSWVKMRLYEKTDFSKAVVEGGGGGEDYGDDSSGDEGGEYDDEADAKRLAAKGRPDFIDFDFSLGGPPPGPNVISSGKHPRTGMRYAMAFLAGSMWPRFEAELEKLG